MNYISIPVVLTSAIIRVPSFGGFLINSGLLVPAIKPKSFCFITSNCYSEYCIQKDKRKGEERVNI